MLDRTPCNPSTSLCGQSVTRCLEKTPPNLLDVDRRLSKLMREARMLAGLPAYPKPEKPRWKVVELPSASEDIERALQGKWRQKYEKERKAQGHK